MRDGKFNKLFGAVTAMAHGPQKPRVDPEKFKKRMSSDTAATKGGDLNWAVSRIRGKKFASSYRDKKMGDNIVFRQSTYSAKRGGK